MIRFLRDGIATGRFVPGQRLVEAELTAELGVSRGPLREALRQLSAEGLVELVPHRGALVRRLSRREAMELFEIRTELEALAARLAASRMLDAAVRERFTCHTAELRLDAARTSQADYIHENKRFHESVAHASGNAELGKLARSLQLGLIMAQVRSALPGEVIESSLAEHRRIADAILSRDADGAAYEMRRHLGRAMAFLAALPEGLFRR